MSNDITTNTPSFDSVTRIIGNFPATIIAVLILVALAFFSYFLFKKSVELAGAISLGVFGYYFSIYIVFGANGGNIINGVDVASIIGFACAILGAIIAHSVYKLAIFSSGAAIGYMLGSVILAEISRLSDNLYAVTNPAIVATISTVLSMVLGCLFLMAFKPLYIGTTSVGGMVAASYLLISSVFVDQTIGRDITALVVGVLLGVVAIIYQYKNDDDYYTPKKRRKK